MVPQTKVFVGSLPLGSKPEELRRLFERYGVVTECDVMNRCGFVHMQTEDMASNAIRALNNTSFNGGVITVERGRIKERNNRGGGGGGGGPPSGGPRRMNNQGGPGPMRGGPPMRGDRMPYGRPPMGGGGLQMRNGRPPMPNYHPPMDDGYAQDDRRYGMMDNRGYSTQPPAGYQSDDRRAAHMGYPPDDRRQPQPGGLYDDRRQQYMDDRQNMRGGGGGGGGMRPPPMSMQQYDRGAPRGQPPMGNGDIFTRRSPPQMRGGYGDRDPYGQQYPPLGRVSSWG